MWIIIILVIVFIIGLFLFDFNQQSSKIKEEGGMRVKYRELINLLMEGDPQQKIFQETSNSITLGVSNMGGSTFIVLTQTFGKLTVQWKVDSPIFGKHKLEWDFPENSDVKKIVERIESDAKRYQQKVLVSHGYPDLPDY